MSADHFNQQVAQSYDERARLTASVNANMHFLMRLLLKELPAKARILCVGVGTGSEILALAEAHPEAQFVGIDPSASMLEVCRERLTAAGLMKRCELFNGYLADLPASEPFDAVLCLLVAHFIKEPSERASLFQGLADRLRSGGRLIHSEISQDLSSPAFPLLLEGWKGLHAEAGGTPEKLAEIPKVLRETLGVRSPSEVERLLQQSGFSLIAPFFQSLLIRGWCSIKAQLLLRAEACCALARRSAEGMRRRVPETLRVS